MPEAVRDVEALVNQLQSRGVLSSASLESALRAVPRAPLLARPARALSCVDAPAPLATPTAQAAPCPSPRVVATLLEALAIQPGDDVLVEGSGVAWTAALAAHQARDGRVLAVERDDDVRTAVRDRVEGLGLPNLELADVTEIAVGGFDRVLVASRTETEHLPRSRLTDEGQLVAVVPGLDGRELDLARVVRHGPEEAQMRLGGLHVASEPQGRARPVGGVEPAHREGPLTARRLLAFEALLAAGWQRGRPVPTASREDASVPAIREAVEETIGRALTDRGLRESAPERTRAAEGAFHVGYACQWAGELQASVHAYTASAEIVPTAEAYTFRGWATSFAGDLPAAIDDCKRAIETDPDLGNPYNDIGAYLIELDRPGDAVEWLEEAMDAPRYASPAFPHLNLGRAYLDLGREGDARAALERALELDPDCAPAEQLLRRIEESNTSSDGEPGSPAP